jgi:hypothetical protein
MRVSQMIGTKKVKLIVIWGIDEFCLVDMMPPGVCFNIGHFLIHVMGPLLAKIFPEGKAMHFD